MWVRLPFFLSFPFFLTATGFSDLHKNKSDVKENPCEVHHFDISPVGVVAETKTSADYANGGVIITGHRTYPLSPPPLQLQSECVGHCQRGLTQ